MSAPRAVATAAGLQSTATRMLEQFAGMHVLIVDDNISNVTFLKMLLERQGLERVFAETDARQVERQLAECRPDLVLLDLHMPHIDGFELLERIQAYAGGTYLPVVVLTADMTVTARNRALAQGAQDFLTKPLDTVETCLRIANLLQTRQIYSTLRQTAEGWPDVRAPHKETFEQKRTKINAVLRDRSIRPVFQPVMDTTSLEVVGYEALARFPDPPLLTPDRWFADAAAVGLGVELEWLAVTAAIEQLDAVPDDLFLALNLSPAAILHAVSKKLFRPELCHRLVIEITEHVPVEDYAALHRALAELKSFGARISADDVGAGYAGFRHLLRLQPDIIKLDISLVAGIDHNDDQRALARALVTFATEVGACIIAEGVEDKAELVALRELNIPWAQGYHLGRPGLLTEPHAEA